MTLTRIALHDPRPRAGIFCTLCRTTSSPSSVLFITTMPPLMTMPPLLLTWFRPVGRRKCWGFSLLFQWIFTSFCVQKWQNKHQNSVFVCYKHRGDRKKSPAALKTGQKHQIWVILIRIWKLMTMPPLVIDNLGTRGGIVVINSTDRTFFLSQHVFQWETS